MNDILLIEDSEDDARLLELALKSARVRNRLIWMSNGPKAVSYLDERESTLALRSEPNPSVFLIDLNLGEVSGLTILETLQNRAAFSKSLRIILSGSEDAQTLKQAYQLGAHSCLTKPLGGPELQALIAIFPEYWLLQ